MKSDTRRALLLVDWQNDYFPGGRYALASVVQAAGRAKALLDAARTDGLQIIHVQHVSEQEDAPFFVRGTSGMELYRDLEPKLGESIIKKQFPNSFRQTGLLNELRERGVEELIVTGAMSHVCIDAVVRAAVDMGFKCVVAHDACATRDLEFNGVKVPAAQVHAAYMAALAFGYAEVVTTAEVLS